MRELETWNPKLRFLEQTPALAGYEKVETTILRWIYRLLCDASGRDFNVLNRFEY